MRFSKKGLLFVSALGVLVTLSGCLSPIALHRAVLEYDRVAADIQAEMLLLNVARAKHHEPLHFTAVSSVAATFNFQLNAGWIGRLGEHPVPANQTSLTLGASASENPTVTIIPVEGKDFTKRLLTPLNSTKILFLTGQGVEPSKILRLVGHAFQDTRGPHRRLLNDPRFKDQYIEFRRITLHLTSLALSDSIRQYSIVYEEEVPTPHLTDSPPTETTDTVIAALKAGYVWKRPVEGGAPVLTRLRESRRIVTNYDPSDLSHEQRRQLYEEVQGLPENAIFIEIRRDGPGGEYPIRGYYLFRSFLETLRRVAMGISAVPEFDVEKDPRTGPIPPQNPARALAVQETSHEPSNALFKVQHAGSWYWIAKPPENVPESMAWDQTAFRMLVAMYNMTVTDISQQPRPAITIAK